MQKTLPQLGPLETQAFAWVQLKKRPLVRSGDLGKVLYLTPKRESELLGRLCRSQMVLRLMKGLYLFPLQIPPGGRWGPNFDWVLTQLMNAHQVSYQVTGLCAFHRYGFSEQVPNRITVYNTKFSGEKIIGQTGCDFIKVDSHRLGHTDSKITIDKTPVVYSSQGRALFDAFYDWDRFGTMPRVFEWLSMKINDDKVIDDFIEATVRYGNISTTRRVGYMLDRFGISKSRIKKISEIAKETVSFIPLDPSKSKEGSIDKNWGVIVNTNEG